jgi:hypothetical protein
MANLHPAPLGSSEYWLGFSEQNPTRLSGSGGCQIALGNARGNRFSPYPSGQCADELDKRLLHIDAEILSHACGLGFELGQFSPEEGCPCGDAQSIAHAGNEHIFQNVLPHTIHCGQALHHVGEADVVFQAMQVDNRGARLTAKRGVGLVD